MFASGASVLPFCLVVGVAVFVLGVFTPDGSVLIVSSGFSGFGLDATDVVANPRAGLAAGFFFLPAMMIFQFYPSDVDRVCLHGIAPPKVLNTQARDVDRSL